MKGPLWWSRLCHFKTKNGDKDNKFYQNGDKDKNSTKLYNSDGDLYIPNRNIPIKFTVKAWPIIHMVYYGTRPHLPISWASVITFIDLCEQMQDCAYNAPPSALYIVFILLSQLSKRNQVPPLCLNWIY